MSDIAVTWAKAQTCPTLPKKGREASHKPTPDRNAKQVLVHLASYADAEGEVWALVPLLAMEMDVSDRTVQRGLAALQAAGLIRATGQNKNHNGRLVPYYRLQLEVGPANTKARIRAMKATAPGDACVTPSKDAPRHRRHPTGDTGDTARGDTGVTQIGKEDSQGLTPSASARAKAERLWAGKAPERVSPMRVAAAWEAAIARTRVEPDALMAAVTNAVRRDPDFGRGKAMNLDRWLDEGRFLAWLGAADAEPERRSWSGPDEVKSAVAGVMGAPAMASYFEPARWDGERRVVLTPTQYAADRLRKEAGAALRAMGVTVECEVKRG